MTAPTDSGDRPPTQAPPATTPTRPPATYPLTDVPEALVLLLTCGFGRVRAKPGWPL